MDRGVSICSWQGVSCTGGSVIRLSSVCLRIFPLDFLFFSYQKKKKKKNNSNLTTWWEPYPQKCSQNFHLLNFCSVFLQYFISPLSLLFILFLDRQLQYNSELSGTIPSTIAACTSLTYLFASSNIFVFPEFPNLD